MSLPRKPHHKGFKPRQKPLARKTEMRRDTPGARRFADARTPLARTPLARTKPPQGTSTLKRTPINPVSRQRQAEQRKRVAMIERETGGVPVLCERCGQAEANDAHEIVPRSKGGSITDRANVRWMCRDCHNWIHANPKAAKAEGWLA